MSDQDIHVFCIGIRMNKSHLKFNTHFDILFWICEIKKFSLQSHVRQVSCGPTIYNSTNYFCYFLLSHFQNEIPLLTSCSFFISLILYTCRTEVVQLICFFSLTQLQCTCFCLQYWVIITKAITTTSIKL